MKKILFALIALTAIIGLAGQALAHPGNTDSSGCHTCRTNCSSWGLGYGEYHCHNAKQPSQPYEPIKSTWGDNGTGYTQPAPEYSYSNTYQYTAPAPTPTCPLFSSYDSSVGSCVCNSGYIAEGASCKSASSYCTNSYGYGAQYSYLDKSCECRYGYKWNDSSTKCIDEDAYCQEKFGRNSEEYLGSCRCKSGYVTNENKDGCISGDTYCQNIFGLNAEQNYFSEQCECKSGYSLTNGLCSKPVAQPAKDNTYKPLFTYTESTNTKTPEPTVKTVIEVKPVPKKAPVTPAPSQARTIKTPTEPVRAPVQQGNTTACDNGFAPSLSGKRCVKIPKNAHAVVSTQDVWLCDEGYNEIRNTCVKITAEPENTVYTDTKEEGTEKVQPERKQNFFSSFVRNMVTSLFGFRF